MGRPILDDKQCSSCKERKPKSEFYGTVKKSGTCKGCQRNGQIARRLYLVDYLKTHPCVDCGEADPVVLDFDHLGDKKDEVTRMIRNNITQAALDAEIAKCEIRCANCHRRRTAKQFGWKYRLS